MTNPQSKTLGQKKLDELELQFAEYRRNRPYKKAAIPNELLQAAFELGKHLDDTTIRARLGITNKQFKRIRALNESNNDQKSKPDDFIELTQEVQSLDKAQSKSKNIELEIRLPNGALVKVSHLEISAMSLLSSILGEPAC